MAEDTSLAKNFVSSCLRGKKQISVNPRLNFSNIFEYFQTFHPIFQTFHPIFQTFHTTFRTFSIVFKRFYFTYFA